MGNSTEANQETTIASVLTPSGRGAVAVVLVAGPGATGLVSERFIPASGRSLAEAPLQRILFGRWGSTLGEEVLVRRRTEVQIEICCHGGRAAVEALVDSLRLAGCRILPWTEWLLRADPDPIRAQASTALAACRTERTAAILLDQHQGSLRCALDQVLDAIRKGDVPTATVRLRALAGNSSLGLHLAHPWKVVLAGRTNVGKSSLINALIGYRRAIIFDRPGTTRDVVTETTAIEGWPMELADTAGLRASNDPLERLGMDETRKRLSAADCVVLVDETGQPWSAEKQELWEASPNPLVVYNKSDLTTQRPNDGPGGHLTSAVTGEGIGELMRAIAARLVPLPPARGEAVPFTVDQAAAVNESLQAIEGGRLHFAIDRLASISSR